LVGLKASLYKETDSLWALLLEAGEALQSSGKNANLNFNKLVYLSIKVKILTAK